MLKHCLKYKRKPIKYFCTFAFYHLLTTGTLPHRILFWLFVSYVNTLIGACYPKRTKYRVLSSCLSCPPPSPAPLRRPLDLACCQQNEQTVMGKWKPEGGEEVVQKHWPCKWMSGFWPSKVLLWIWENFFIRLLVCLKENQKDIHRVLSILAPMYPLILPTSVYLTALSPVQAAIILNPNY